MSIALNSLRVIASAISVFGALTAVKEHKNAKKENVAANVFVYVYFLMVIFLMWWR